MFPNCEICKNKTSTINVMFRFGSLWICKDHTPQEYCLFYSDKRKHSQKGSEYFENKILKE